MVMSFAGLIENLPKADVPFDDVEAYMLRSSDGLAVFFHFHKDTDLPEHSHRAQWGTVLEGEIELTIAGVKKTYKPGESYSIATGELHGGTITAGTKLLDFFENPDRFQPLAE